MKKKIATRLVAMLAFSVVGCKGTDKTADDSTESKQLMLIRRLQIRWRI